MYLLYNNFSSYPAGRAVYHLQQLWSCSKNCHLQEKWCPGHGRISFTALGLVSNPPTKSKDTLEKSLALKSLYILVKVHKTCELQIWLKYLLPHSFRVPVSILNLGFCLSFSTKVFFLVLPHLPNALNGSNALNGLYWLKWIALGVNKHADVLWD